MIKKFPYHKIYINVCLLLSFMVIISCERDYLKPWPPDGARQPSDVWNFYAYSRGFLDRIYADNLFTCQFNDIEGAGMLASATDEAVHSSSSGAVRNFVNGTWNSTNVPRFLFEGYYAGAYNSHWSNSYIAIRRVNVFLENVDESVLIDDMTIPDRNFDRTYYKAQAYFFRAWFQFELFKRYGAFPIILKSLSLADDIYQPRNTMEECYNQIIEDVDKAIENLPVIWNDNDWHRPNKSSAHALKSRVTLYYASPLYQGDIESFGLAKNEVGDVNRWKAAVSASREAVNDNSFYKLMPVTRFTAPYGAANTYSTQVFQVMPLPQTEYIFGIHSWYRAQNEIYNLPAGVEGCYGYTNPTQEMVDEFEVVSQIGSISATAEKFDWNNPAHANNPYANRDPRFYASILYNGAFWGISASKGYTVDTYEGGVHRDRMLQNSTKTGYYFRKGLNESYYKNASGFTNTIPRVRIEMRFAELILNFAEAMNEAYGPDVIDPDGGLVVGLNTATSMSTAQTAREAINAIRARVKMPPIASGMSREQMREAIKHERNIELCFEGHRFFDARRWKEGEKLGATIHGIDIQPTGFNANNRPTGFTYEVVRVEDRVWSENMYWFPIPYSEIVKYEGKLIQNKGW